MNNDHFLIINRSVEWVVLVAVLGVYMIIRSRHLHWAERLFTGLFGAGLAFVFTEDVSDWPLLGGSELSAAVLIMLVGPAVLNAILTFGENKEFINGLLEGWARNKLGVKDDKGDR